MRLSLFSRLSIGYLAIFLIVAVASSYAIVQLDFFRGLTQSILIVDNRIVDYQKSLGELLLAQSRAEQKFFITKDDSWFSQFIHLKMDFEAQLGAAAALKNRVAAPMLGKIQRDYLHYQEVVNSEAQLVHQAKSYPQAKYKQDKDKLVDGMLDALEKLRINQQQSTYAKVSDLATAADEAREASVSITMASLVIIVLMSFLITKSITRPIGLLKNRTREIAKGNFHDALQISSPPEIGELAGAINAMCARLQELDRMKADFFASMSHELRTPLTSIKEGTGLLLEGVGGETTDKQRKLLAILAEESNRLINVVNSLLDLSKMEAGMMTYDFELGNIDPLIRRALAEMSPLIEAKQIRLETHVQAPLPLVRIDPERILQVLRNLLGNAVKFTPKGGQISVIAKPANGKLQVCVKDSGPGIPVESLISIFEKFSQGNHKGSHTRQGTGLGLAIAKSIIASHGGRIWAESQVGQGSTFIFVLPS
ncbi:MAG TPA: ATP-binding protein [Terriglobales bacterium]|nr:ATP-binding protein [Terriglobales bacterium]